MTCRARRPDRRPSRQSQQHTMPRRSAATGVVDGLGGCMQWGCDAEPTAETRVRSYSKQLRALGSPHLSGATLQQAFEPAAPLTIKDPWFAAHTLLERSVFQHSLRRSYLASFHTLMEVDSCGGVAWSARAPEWLTVTAARHAGNRPRDTWLCATKLRRFLKLQLDGLLHMRARRLSSSSVSS